MPFGKSKDYAASPNAITNYVVLDEPPDADPHVRWCERGRLAAAPYSIARSLLLPLYYKLRARVNPRAPRPLREGDSTPILW
jgi:hypothetical protein